jgi:hypothetical protein
MTNETIVFKKDAAAIEAAICAREEKRQAVAQALQGLQGALRDLYRKEPTLADVEPFLERSAGDAARRDELATEIETRAAEVWLRINPYPIMPERLMEAMDPPPGEVRAVADAWRAIDLLNSDDLTRYWSAARQGFAPPPVSKSERAGIEQSHTLVYISPSHKTALDHLEGVLALANMKVHKPEGAILYGISKLAHGLTRLNSAGKAEPIFEKFVKPAGPPPSGFFG